MTNFDETLDQLNAKLQELESQLQLREEEVKKLRHLNVMLEEQLAQAILSAKMDVWEYDVQDCSFHCSGSLSKDLNIDPESYQNSELRTQIFPGEELSESNQSLRKPMKEEIPEFRLEHRLSNREGKIYWVLSCGRLVRDDHGQPLRVIGTTTDISEQKDLDKALAETENRFKLLAHVTRDAIYDCDFRTGKVWRNRAYTLLLGPPNQPGDTIQWWKDHIHPEDRETVISTFENCMQRKGSSWSAEYRFKKADTTYAFIIDRGYFFYDEEGEPLRMIGAATDISALKNAEYERSLMERKLLETQKFESIGVLSGGIAHKFNNLLTPMLGSSGHLLNILPADSQIIPLVEVIHNASKSAAELVQQLLSYAGKAKLSVEAIDLSQVLRDMQSLFRAVIPPALTFSVELADSLPLFSGDMEQLRQLVMILLTNAAESLEDEPGQVVLRTGQFHADADYLCKCYLSKDLPTGPYLFVEVEDTGKGIPETYQNKIFDPFFSTKFFGRGLGLATALGILRAHKGAICVTSEPDQGSLFRAIFPISSGEMVTPESSTVQPYSRSYFLIIEDEGWVREMVQRILESEGHKVLLAEDGEMGLDLFHKHAQQIGCVILDVAMPKKNGLEVLRELRTYGKDLPVVIISGFAEAEIVQQIKSYSNVRFLHKPFTVGEFLASI